MSLDWSDCTECQAYNVGAPDGPIGRSTCNEERSLMVAEGMRLTERLRWAEDKLERYRELLDAVLLSRMGGVPDLFGPDGGWDAWDARARAALSGETIQPPEKQSETKP